MADLRYKVVVDDVEARRRIRELLSNTGVSSALNDTKRTASGIEDVRAATVKLKEAQLASIDALRQTRLEQAKQKKEQTDLNTAYLQGRVSLQEFRSEQARLNAARKEEVRQARETKRALQENTEYRKLTAELNRVRNEAKNTLAEMARLERQGYKTGASYQSLSKRSADLVAQTNVLDRTVKKIDATVGQHQRNVGNYGDAITMVMPQLSQFTGRLGLLAAGVAAVKQSFDTNLRLEPINQALLTASGKTQNFDRNLEFLRVTSDRLGLQFISTATSFKLWQGAAKFSNLTARESRDIFESVANAGAKMKLSNDQVEGTFLALSQMMSKGKVQAEELRGQLGERLPGAFSLAARAMGVTEQALNKMLEQGEVLSAEFLPKFAAELDKTFGNDKTERIDGMQAAVNRLSNEFDSLWQSERATNFFTTVSDGFARMFKEINLMINSKSWDEFKAIGFGGLDDHAKWKKSQLSPLQQVLDGFDSMPKVDMEKTIVSQKISVDLARRENDGSTKKLDNLKWQEAVLYNMTEEYRAQYGISKSLVKLDAGKAKAKAIKEAERLRQATERQRALQLSINQMNEDASRKQLSRDQEEIASISDKYKKIREEARKFQADPKNKGLRVDLGGLRRSENFEISEAETRQGTTKLIDQLNKQKVIYDEYNAYVASTSVSKADDLYKDQLDIIRDFKLRLKQEYMDIITLEQTAAEGVFGGSDVKLTQAQEERAKALREMIEGIEKQEESQRRQRLSKALEDNRTYQQKLIDLENEFKNQYAALGDGITEDQKRILLERRQAEIDSLNETEAAKNAILVKGAKQYLMVTTASIVAQIKVVKDLLAREDISDDFRGQLTGRLAGLERSLRLGATAVNLATAKSKAAELRSELVRLSNTKGVNPKEIEEVIKALGEAQEDIDQFRNEKLMKLFDVMQMLSGELNELGQSFTNLGEAFQNSRLTAVGVLLSGISSNLNNLSVAFDKNAESAEKYAAAAQSAINMISVVANASAERRRAEEEYYRSIIALQREYNLSLNDQIRLQSQLEESVYVTDYIGRVQSGMLAAEDAIKGYQGAMNQLIKDGKIAKGLESAVDWGNVGKGAGSGAAIGATIGSVVPILGTIIGGAIGAIVGGIVGLFGGKKKKPKYEDLYANLPKEIVDVLTSSEPRDLTEVKNLLQSMNNDKAVDANTKGMIEGVLEWIAKIEEARAQIKEVVVELSGQIGSELRNSLVEAFRAGEDAASAMGKTVNKVLEDVISNILFAQAFEKLFKDFEEDFTDALLIGDTAGIVDVFAGFLDKAGPAAEQFYSWMDTFQKEAQKKGLDIFGNSTSSSSLGSEGIAKQITESTGSEIVGTFRAGYDIWKRQLNAMELQSKTQVSLLQVANDKLLVLNAINVNTANTVARLDTAVKHLQNIDKNLGGAYARN